MVSGEITGTIQIIFRRCLDISFEICIIYSCDPVYGEVVEWFKAAVLKTAVVVRLPWVRIPPSPPNEKEVVRMDNFFLFLVKKERGRSA